MTAAQCVIALDVGGTGMKCALVGRTAGRHADRAPPPGPREPGRQAVVDDILDVAAGLADAARERGLEPGRRRRRGARRGRRGDRRRGLLGERRLPRRTAAGAASRSASGCPPRSATTCAPAAWPRPASARRATRGTCCSSPSAPASRRPHVVDGRPFAGAHGAAGEIGHVVVEPGGRPCGCGGRGCLEAVASAAAIGRRYAARWPASPRGHGRRRGGPRRAPASRSPRRSGREAVEALADGLLTARRSTTPGSIVRRRRAGRGRRAAARPAAARRSARGSPSTGCPELVRAALGDKAGCLGAALLAWRRRRPGGRRVTLLAGARIVTPARRRRPGLDPGRGRADRGARRGAAAGRRGARPRRSVDRPRLRRPARPRRRRAHLHHRRRRRGARGGRLPPARTAPPRCWPAWSARRTADARRRPRRPALALVAEGVLAGIHFEGPYLSAAALRRAEPGLPARPVRGELAALIELGERRGPDGHPRARAARRAGARSRLLVAAGVVAAIGHTDATYEQTLAGVAAGARVGTHLFNGMRAAAPPRARPGVALLDAARVVVRADRRRRPPARRHRCAFAARPPGRTAPR